MKKVNLLSKSPLNAQTSTDDEIPQESVSVAKEENSSKKKVKKNRRERKDNEMDIEVPEVDLIDHAYISDEKLTTTVLAARKEKLMARRIVDSNDFLQGRKVKI